MYIMILFLFWVHIGTILYRNCAKKRIAKGVFYTSFEFSLFSVSSKKLKPLNLGCLVFAVTLLVSKGAGFSRPTDLRTATYKWNTVR